MIKFIICDDVPVSSECLKKSIKSIADNYDIEYQIVIFDNADDFIGDVSSNEYDIYFIDISMPDARGDFLARFVKITHPFAITALVSSYEDFGDIACTAMVDAYLYKSYDEFQMRSQILRLLQKCADKRKKYTFSTIDSDVSIFVCDIIYIESSKRKLYVHLYNGTIFNVYDETLNSLKKNIEIFYFHKISRSCLLNMEAIEGSHSKKYNHADSELKNGDIIELHSESSIKKFNENYKTFLRDFLQNEYSISEMDIKNLKR